MPLVESDILTLHPRTRLFVEVIHGTALEVGKWHGLAPD